MTSKKKKKNQLIQGKLLVEVAWEVCNQVGGIYTVIRSKAPVATKIWGDQYALLGPYIHPSVATDFEEHNQEDNAFNRVVQRMKEWGWGVYYGRWLVSGRPQTVLFDPNSVMHDLGSIKYDYWQKHHIGFENHDPLMDQVMAFGHMVRAFLSELARECHEDGINLLAHFHEWMAGTCIPDLRKEQIPIKTIFTTHATILGRYLAMNDPQFYDHLPFINWEDEAKNFNIETTAKLERACAHGAHVFSTVSEVTGNECVHLIGRNPDVLLPNGFNIERFAVLHEVQNLHQQFKNRIKRFVMGHFFQSYSFDLDKTLFFFTSGRFEFRNKGYDLTLEALARLNHKMKERDTPVTIVVFFVTRQPTHSINPNVLNSRAMLEEIEKNCDQIARLLKQDLFEAAASNENHRLPDLRAMVDDYWKLRYRRTIGSWKSDGLPSVTTHNLINDNDDPILGFLRSSGLINKPEDKVKVVYHPDFISSTNPLFGMEYGEFVRGCHLGVFPSFYEPWGYTPLECLASGVPAVTSNLSGFGDFVQKVPLGDENMACSW